MNSYNYFLGIDIAKESFDIALLNKDSDKVVKKKNLKMNNQGFTNIIEILNQHDKTKKFTFIVMESTGSYHLTILSYLVNNDYTVALVNPQLIKSFISSMTLRKSINDEISAKHIAQFAKVRYHNLETVSKDSISSLKSIIRERDNIVKSISQQKNQIRDLVNRLFPELEKLTDIFSKTVLQMLRKAPSANKLAQQGLNFIQKSINNSKGSKLKVSAQELLTAAQNSIGLNDKYLEKALTVKLNHFINSQNTLAEIENIINEAVSSNNSIKKNSKILKSIRGINDKTAIPFLIESGIAGTNIENIFPSHKQLIAYAGTDPAIKQSGTSINYRGGISKKGNSYLRKVIYNMARTVSQYNTYFKEYYRKKRDEGKCYSQAIIAVGNKLIKIIYALLKNQSYYNSEKHLNQVNWIA